VIGFAKEIFFESDLSNVEEITFTIGAQFIVPKELILNKSLDWWKSLYSYYNHYWDSNIDSLFSHIQPGHFIGHVFERLWNLIFKYNQQNKDNNNIIPLLNSASC
jgi:hypothetical protein